MISDGPCIKQNFDLSGNIDSNNSSMTNTIPMPSVTKTINTEPISFAPKPKPIERSDQRTPSFKWKRTLATPGMGSFNQQLFKEGISKEFASYLKCSKIRYSCSLLTIALV